MTSAEGFKAGAAYIDLDIRDNTAEGTSKAKAEIENAPAVELPVKASDPITPEWKQKTRKETEGQEPLKVPTKADDPINAAWRARVQASIKAIASDAIKIPMVPETAKYREELELAVGELSSSLKQKIPVDMDGADQFRLHVEELAREVSAEVKAKIPVEIDQDKTKEEVDAVGADVGKAFTGSFSTGIAPMPALIGAAVLAGAPLVGGAMIGVAGAGMAAAAVAIASGTPGVMSRWMALGDDMSKQADSLRPRLEAPIVDALDTVRDRFDVLAPQVANDLVSAEVAIKPLTDGVLGLAQNALPGMTMAVSRQSPVMEAFKTLLEDTGTSVGDMFEQFSQHTGAFGDDIRSLDSILISATGFLTNLITQTGEAWSANSDQISGAVMQLFDGFSSLAGTAIPALTSELADVLSVLGFVASTVGDVTHAIGPLSGDIMAVALSAKLLGINLTEIPALLGALPGKLAEAAVGGGRFAGVSGLLADALPAVGTGLGVVAAGFGLVALGASAAAAHEQDLVDAGTALGHSVIAGGTAAADAGNKLNDMEDKTNKLKVQIQQLSSQANSGTTAVNEYGGGFSVTASKSMELQGQLQDLNTELKAATDAENSYKKELGPLGVAQARAAQAQKDYNDAVSQNGAASAPAEAAAKNLAKANAEVTVQQQNLNNAMSLTKASMGTFEKPAIALQSDLAKIGNEATTDSDKIKAMKDALIALSGGKIPVGDAMEAIDKSLSAINDEMIKGITQSEGYGKALLNADGSIRTVTKNGQSLRDHLSDLRGKFVDAAAAIVAEDEAQGKSADEAKAHAQVLLEQQIPAVEKLGEKMGLSKDQVDAALKSMGAWPADLVTLVATPGAMQAQQAMDILRGKVMDVPNDRTVHTAALTDTATKALRDLGFVVTTLPDGTVNVTANTDVARASTQSLIRDINGMRATITVDAAGNTSSLTFGSRVAGHTASAAGNLLVPMASGGFGGHPLSPMSGAQAQMVPPNTWRVVGDNMSHTELYAPLDGSQRSASLITQAAQHEKLSIGGNTVTINQTVISSDPQQAADRAAGAVAWAMSSARG